MEMNVVERRLEDRWEGGDTSRHVTSKFDADADADFANEYNLWHCFSHLFLISFLFTTSAIDPNPNSSFTTFASKHRKKWECCQGHSLTVRIQALNVMIWIPQFVRNSQVCHWVTKSLNRSQRLCLCFRICLCLLVVYNIAPHPSNQLSERSYVSTTALQCSEDAEIKTLLTHSLTHSMSDKVTYWSVLDSQKNHQLWGRWWEDRFRYLILCSKRLTLSIIWFLISFVKPK